MPDHDLNPDRAQVRDFGAVNHPRPIMADLGAIPGVIGVSPTDADVARLRDEVAYLTRDRDALRERAELAEADADVMALCMAVCEGRVVVMLNQPQRSMIAARLHEAYRRSSARGRDGGAA